MTKQFYTYLYRDPKDNTPIYVGYGYDTRAWQHYTSHNRAGEKTALCKLLHERINEKQTPLPTINYEPDEGYAMEMEKFWINFYGRADLGKGTLLNLTDGGKGCRGYKFPEGTHPSHKNPPNRK